MNLTNEKKSTKMEEKVLNPKSGLVILLLNLGGILFGVILIIISANLPPTEQIVSNELGAMMFSKAHPLTLYGILLAVLVVFPVCSVNLFGLKTVSPNEALVLTLFGNYYGTINKSGFFYVNPFCSAYNPTKAKLAVTTSNSVVNMMNGTKDESNNVDKTSGKKISMKAITLNNRIQKVNDSDGNPIEVAAMVIWKVNSPCQAVFSVDNYLEYISMQADSTLRNVVCRYAYDEGEVAIPNQQTLRGNSEEIAETLLNELQKKVEIAGLEVLEVKLTHLAYAPEIAAAMLQRQQASAILAARRLIVDGAVGMVQQALEKLAKEDIVCLDDERKAAMISNLLVVLCANKEAQPVVNSGSIY